MPPRRANFINMNAKNANTSHQIPDQEVSNVEIKNVIQMLAYCMSNQNNWVHAPFNANGGSEATRVHDFVRMNLPEFLGSQTNENPQNFLDEIKKIFETMQVTGNDRLKVESYQFKDVAHIWYIQLKDTTPITWVCISKTFLDRFFLIELREAKAQEFMNLSREA